MRTFNIGDVVYDERFGYGTVTKILNHLTYGIFVSFVKNNSIVTFTHDGKWLEYKKATLRKISI